MLRLGEKDRLRPQELAVGYHNGGQLAQVCSGSTAARSLLHEQLYPEADVLLMGQTKANAGRVLLSTT